MKKQDEMTLEDSWIDELYEWADSNNIPDLQCVECDELGDDGKRMSEGFWVGLPRDREVLVNLEELDLSWHNCSEIPEQIRHLKKLKKFSFSKSRDGLVPPFYKIAYGLDAIKEIPDWIAELENLEELDLSDNNIKYVPKAIGKLKNLKKLYLHYNKIMFVEDELGSLAKLEVLWIQRNKLSIRSDCIDILKKLAPLDVQCEQPNKLSELMHYFEKSESLCFERITESQANSLALLSDGFAKLRRLDKSASKEVLWDEWNKLSDIKHKLHGLKNLRVLYCDGLERTKYGPIKLCPEGLVVSVEVEPVPENESAFLLEDTPVFLLNDDAFEVVIELKEHHGKSLIEKVDFMGLWK
ncbi:MAG: leucine-rich repeat domain-containing protein [Motiliproteus sp.]